jgi:hypothetical protein
VAAPEWLIPSNNARKRKRAHIRDFIWWPERSCVVAENGVDDVEDPEEELILPPIKNNYRALSTNFILS